MQTIVNCCFSLNLNAYFRFLNIRIDFINSLNSKIFILKLILKQLTFVIVSIAITNNCKLKKYC